MRSMSDESSQDVCRQIVFLIDCNPSYWGSNYCAENAANAIRLCVLRVLTYFNDNGKGKRSNLRWGYKFFNSRSLSHQFERHEFKDFSVEVFEEFENQASKRLNESFAQQLQVNTLEQTEQDPDGKEISTFGKPPAGAKCISCAFTNAVHDFQWERPDISSPVRRTRGNNLLGNRSKTRNVMFLLSACPCDDDSISGFIGESSSSPRTFDVVKNILMPSVLYKEFKQRHISLHWVNTGKAQQEENTSLKSLLDAFVEQLDGCLIPLSALIHTGNILSLGSGLAVRSGRDVSSCKEVTSSSHGPLLPLKTVMDFYFHGQTAKLTEAVNITQHQMKLGCSETTGFVCSSGTDVKLHCCVKLHSMFQPVAKKQDPKDNHQTTRTESIDTTTKMSTSDENESSPPNLLWIRGVISHASVCPTWLHPTKGYSCIGMDSRCTDDSTNSTLCSQRFISGWFQELLLSLAKENKLLVLDFIDCDSGLPVSGVLQPLTSVCGVISVIASDFLVMFEKLLLWNGKTSLLKRKNVESVETSHHLVNEHKSKTDSKPAEPLGYTEVFLRLMRSKNNFEDQTTTDARNFDAGFVDPWCSFPVVDDTNRLLPSELRRGDESEEEEDVDDSDDDESEANLIKQLKKLYNNKETKSATTALNGRQSLKQAKRKISTPKKTKVKKDALKLSSKTLGKKTETNDQINKLDENESQAAVNKNEIEDSCTTEDKPITNNPGAQAVPYDIKDEAELVKVAHDLCNKVILEGADILKEINNIVTLVSLNYENGAAGREKDCVSKFLGEHLLLTVSALRGKYEGCSDIIRTGQQVREYQLQILLRMEIAVLANADENSSLVEEVTVLLRAISFMKDPKFLTVYIREVLLRYSHSLTKFLCGVYEGLMMRPPRELLTPSKWSSDDESPIRRSVNSNSSAKQDSSQPRSSGCRVFTRHLSVTDAVSKRREIVVPGKAKPKEKEKKKKEKPQGSISSRGASKKKEKKSAGQETPVKQVRRNLFTESEEGDENNSSARVPRKRKLSESGGKKDQAKRRFYRRNTVGSLSKSAVQETPAHKQVSHALWNKQDRARKRSRAYTEVHVLQESPLKELQAGEGLPRRSPRRPPAVIFQRSQSFYGRSASAGPLTRTRSFTGACSRDFPKKEPTEGSDSIPSKETVVKKTPQKMSFAAVSPLRFSPRQKKKFSLHSLLTTAKECDRKKERSPSRQRPTTPKEKLMATRSSPRLLKKRSFSCIGFSSVPFPGVQENKLDPLRAKPKSFECTSSKSPSRKAVCSGDVIQESSITTPKKQNADNISEVGKITPKSTFAQPEKRTPLKDYQMDECVVLLTPIRHPLSSPVQISPKIKTNSSSSKDFTHAGAMESSKHFEECSSAPDSNIGTPVKKGISPAVRSSPRLLSKRDISESSKEPLGKSLRKSTDHESKDEKMANPSSVVSPKSSREDLAQSITPVKICPLDDCVVLLTPIRRPLLSPVHVRSQEKNVAVVRPHSESSVQPNSDTHTVSADAEGNLLFKEVSKPMNSPCSSPRIAMSSALDALNERNLRENPSMGNNESTGVRVQSEGKGTEWFNCVSTLTKGNDECRHISAATEGAEPHLLRGVKSPRSARPSPTAAQLLWNHPPQNSTPPPKKGKKKSLGLSNSPAETKRLSPLNQILRQQKRKRCFSSSPADKRSTEAIEMRARDTSCEPGRTPGKETKKKKATRGKVADELSGLNVSCPVVIENNNSRSSEDGDDWLSEMEKEYDRSMAEKNQVAKSPPTKKRRIHKSVVFGKKRTGKETSKTRKNNSTNSSLSSDTSYEEDDEVFQSPAALASACLRRRHLNRTPLSASSIKVLQESPILFDSKLSLSPSVHTRSCSDVSPNPEEYSRKGRLSRRKVVDESSLREASIAEDFVDDQEEQMSFHSRKRLKLNT